jgi:hypothetical protein
VNLPDYLRERERAERLAAQKASSDAARRAHQELADSYARLLKGNDSAFNPTEP